MNLSEYVLFGDNFQDVAVHHRVNGCWHQYDGSFSDYLSIQECLDWIEEHEKVCQGLRDQAGNPTDR